MIMQGGTLEFIMTNKPNLDMSTYEKPIELH